MFILFSEIIFSVTHREIFWMNKFFLIQVTNNFINGYVDNFVSISRICITNNSNQTDGRVVLYNQIVTFLSLESWFFSDIRYNELKSRSQWSFETPLYASRRDIYLRRKSMRFIITYTNIHDKKS